MGDKGNKGGNRGGREGRGRGGRVIKGTRGEQGRTRETWREEMGHNTNGDKVEEATEVHEKET